MFFCKNEKLIFHLVEKLSINVLLICVFKLCLLIGIAYSFKTPKHDLICHYKTPNNVYSTNPFNHTTHYSIYVAGQTIYVDIPRSVVSLVDILKWKVINVDKDRLMFVHNNKAWILINQKTIREMKYSGELSGSIIAFGDHEALHVSKIFNPNSTKPKDKWNYIELLYFDVERETVSVIDSLPWLKSDDWKFIKEWKMTDYIHFNNRLYLLIKRSIWIESDQIVTQEISIIRMCLEKGSKLISSAVETHFTRPEFNNSDVDEVIFTFYTGKSNPDNDSKFFVLLTTQFMPNQWVTYRYYGFANLFPVFELTAEACSKGSNNVTLLRNHLRSEVGQCEKTKHESCSTNVNIVPSVDIVNLVETGSQPITSLEINSSSYFVEYTALPAPIFANLLAINKNNDYKVLLITFTFTSNNTQSKFNFRVRNFITQRRLRKVFYFNKIPFGIFRVINHSVYFIWILSNFCEYFHDCFQCISYAVNYNCVWSNGRCTYDDQSKLKTKLSLNRCFKINRTSPLIFNPSLSKKLNIQLDRVINYPYETITIKAGPHNYCTNITKSAHFFYCTLNLNESGKFRVEFNLHSNLYAETSIVTALSTESVDITTDHPRYSYSFVIISIIFLTVISNEIIIIVCVYCNIPHLGKSPRSIVINSKTVSNELSSKIKVNSTIDSLSRKVLSSQLNVSKFERNLHVDSINSTQ